MDNKFKHEENDKELEIKEEFNSEDTTKYGEFISTYFAWTLPDKQKKKAEQLNNMTKKTNKIIKENNM